MQTYRVAIIGAGRRGDRRGGAYGIAEAHAVAYEASGRAQIVAAADINRELLDIFTSEHRIPAGYTDYREMLAKERPDIVSICTWPQLHAEMAIAAAEAGAKGILCEKPMALTLPDCDLMLAACERHGTTLIIDHQRRLGEPFRLAKEIVDRGDIGELLRVETYVGGSNLYDWGPHWIDMMFFYQNEVDAKWVAAQVDVHGEKVNWGIRVEEHAIVHIQYKNGVRGYLEIGTPIPGARANRLIGSEGLVELNSVNEDRPTIRAKVKGRAEWLVPESDETIHDRRNYARAALDLIRGIDTGEPPELAGARGRKTIEIIVAAYESAYRRGRVNLPADIADSPLQRLVAAAGQT